MVYFSLGGDINNNGAYILSSFDTGNKYEQLLIVLYYFKKLQSI